MLTLSNLSRGRSACGRGMVRGMTRLLIRPVQTSEVADRNTYIRTIYPDDLRTYPPGQPTELTTRSRRQEEVRNSTRPGYCRSWPLCARLTEQSQEAWLCCCHRLTGLRGAHIALDAGTARSLAEVVELASLNAAHKGLPFLGGVVYAAARPYGDPARPVRALQNDHAVLLGDLDALPRCAEARLVPHRLLRLPGSKVQHMASLSS
jgi:hypothetical protein